jgi:hypothetical protein
VSVFGFWVNAHILFYGLYLPQSRIADVWNKVSGNQVVWITLADGRGRGALLYMLKYVSKPPSDDPEMIGKLEVAFHGTRRVHAMGIFYNFEGGQDDCGESDRLSCPKCGAKLVVDTGLRPMWYLRDMGFELLGPCRSQGRNKKWIN